MIFKNPIKLAPLTRSSGLLKNNQLKCIEYFQHLPYRHLKKLRNMKLKPFISIKLSPPQLSGQALDVRRVTSFNTVITIVNHLWLEI
jgi:hypothetical protein